jgi:hypothetical protein
MSQSFRFQINVDCDVENADSEAVARTAAFALLTAVQQSKRGRKPAGPDATITGVKIEPVITRDFTGFDAGKVVMFKAPEPMKPRTLDTADITEG